MTDDEKIRAKLKGGAPRPRRCAIEITRQSRREVRELQQASH
jgi:hypothetical protein